MRTLPLAAALALLAFVPPASAGSTGLSLTGPTDALRAEGPATATIDIALTLQGVTCVGTADIPVTLKVADSKGLKSAALTWESVLFRIGPSTASTQPWTGRSEVGLRVWGQDPTGYAQVVASYALPKNCVASGGITTGQASYMLHVIGPEPAPQVELPPEMPPITHRQNEMATTQESAEVGQRVWTLPVPVLGAIAGMCAGGAVVFYKRMRAASFA